MKLKRKKKKIAYRTLIGYAERDAILWKMGFDKYSDYLESYLWKEIRQQVLSSSEFCCQLCKKPSNQVHHLWYSKENLQGTNKKGLVSLCVKCHHSIEFGNELGKHEPTEARFLYRELSKVDPKDLTKTSNKLNKDLSEKEHFNQIFEDLYVFLQQLKTKKIRNSSEFDRIYNRCWKLLRLAEKLRNKHYNEMTWKVPVKSLKKRESRIRHRLRNIKKIQNTLKQS
jgi:hypothetical protein